MTPEIQAKISIFRQKAAENTLTIEEMREAVLLMREGRVAAAQASSSSSRKAKVKAAVPDADSLLDELGKI